MKNKMNKSGPWGSRRSKVSRVQRRQNPEVLKSKITTPRGESNSLEDKVFKTLGKTGLETANLLEPDFAPRYREIVVQKGHILTILWYNRKVSL